METVSTANNTAEIVAKAAQAPTTETGFAHTTVCQYQGVPTIFVDGQPYHGMTATSCAFGDPEVVRDFVKGGCEIMMIWIEAGISCWKGPGQYDWTYAEEKLRYFEEHSSDTKWLIRIRLGILDEWFARAYPTEVYDAPDADGNIKGNRSVAVIHSSIWLEQVTELIRDFVAWLKTTKWANRIIGFMLNAGRTEEWLPFESDDLGRGVYHPVYEREFRSWLQRHYNNDVEALRAYWRNEQVTFETAGLPRGMMKNGSHIWGLYSLRDPQYERPAFDYYRFMNETLADALITCCRAAKEAAGTPIIAGGFHSYIWWESGIYSYVQEYGHGLVQRLNESPWVDFVSDIASYDTRYPGGPASYLGLPHCQNLHNTLHYTETDFFTNAYLTPEQQEAWAKADPSTIPAGTAEPVFPDRLWKWDYNMCGRDDEEQLAILQREHMHNLITGTPYWWFDIHGHHYQRPALVEGMKQLSDIGKEAIHWDRRTISEVAFVCSEDTPMYQSAMNGTLMRYELESYHALLLDLATRKWGLAGVPFDIYEMHDLAHPDFPGDQYKLIIFVNCAVIPQDAAEGIRRWQRDGKVLCWTFAPGVLDEDHFDPSMNADVVGMKIGARVQRQNIHISIDEQSGHPLTTGGAALSFGTEGSVGPVFFADDPAATVLGRLRDGGEAAFALREHENWKSLYLSMLNFGPELFRNIARFAGAHVWSEGNDFLTANRSILTLHTASAGEKKIDLPAPAYVTDLWTGVRTAEPVTAIEVTMPAYRTQAWRTEY